MSGWIKCTDRMPGPGQHVIILTKGRKVGVWCYDGGGENGKIGNWASSLESFLWGFDRPEYWMPLPELPEEVNA